MVFSNYRSLLNYNYFDKLLRFENVNLFSRQDKIIYIIDTTILILYRKLYINIVSIIVLNYETRQCNVKINLAISSRPIRKLRFFYTGSNSDWFFCISDKTCYFSPNLVYCAIVFARSIDLIILDIYNIQLLEKKVSNTHQNFIVLKNV